MTKRDTISFYIGLILLVSYTLIDATLSITSGVRDANRTVVYLLQALMFLVFAGARVFKRRKQFSTWDALIVGLLLLVLASAIFAEACNQWRLLILVIQTSTIALGSSVFARKNSLTTYVLSFIAAYSVAFLYSRQAFLSSFNVNFYAVNYSYHLVSLVPLLFLLPNKILRQSLLVLTFFFVCYSLKRGAILCFMLGVIASSAFPLTRFNFSPGQVWSFTLGLCSLLFFAFQTDVTDTLQMRFSSSELSSGSGRADNYALILSELSEFSLVEWLFGRGVGSTLTTLGTGAHNEFLDFTYSYGIGGGLWIMIFLGAIAWHAQKRSFGLNYRKGLVFLLVCSTIMSLLSGVFFMIYFLHFMVFLKLGKDYAR